MLGNKLNLLKVIGQGSGNIRLVIPDGVAVTDNIIAVSVIIMKCRFHEHKHK